MAEQHRNWWAEVALVLVLVAVEIGVTAMIHHNAPDRGAFAPQGVALLAVGIASLLWRQRYPTAVLGIVLVTTTTAWAFDYVRGPVFFGLIVAFLNAVIAGRRRAAIAALLVGYVTNTWLGYLVGRDDRPQVEEMLALLAWLIALLAIGEAIRFRRDRAAEAERTREEAARRQAGDERMRIARELHDVVAHNMSLISVQAGVALHLLDEQPEQARESLATIKDASKEALVELRSILGVLRQVDEAERTPVPSLERLDELVEGGRSAGLEVRVERSADVADLPRDVDLAAYRIVQESLTNAARHAHDPRVTVRLEERDGELAVEILDEGRGSINGAVAESGGNGVTGMRERAASVGGRIEIGPRPGRGFAVRAWLPLQPTEEESR